MPRRTRLRTERRLALLEDAVHAQPTVRPSPPITDEQVAGVLCVLQQALGAQGLAEWAKERGLALEGEWTGDQSDTGCLGSSADTLGDLSY
jgi:hypothetical protein